ncbi:MAG: F0F1 ATP synthase subunit epsilon [Alphaproteobacteria bacterium]|nr:F0F1 ATP synthase subunit epsilon [Alphaproteobacteria bacterium]
MVDGKVNFELVSPERLLASTAVDMVVVPGAEGDFGVLPGHAPFISALRAGVIDVHDGGKVTDRIFVADGFAEVTTERCTVLAGEAVPLDRIDRAQVEKRIAEAELDLRDAANDQERARAERALDTARALLAHARA